MANNKSGSSGWFVEQFVGKAGTAVRIHAHLAHKVTPYQVLDVYDTALGRMLVLDGCIMLTEHSEAAYHEMLVHVPLCLHKNPESVLIIGGGDGGAMREVLRHRRVRLGILCEIDKEVIEAAKMFFPQYIAWLNTDSRAKLIIDDGIKFIEGKRSEFDVILIDSTDPVGPAEALFSEEFYAAIARALKPEGIVVTQAESPWYTLETIDDILRKLKAVFGNVAYYTSNIPAYPGGYWGFAIASNSKYDFNTPAFEPPFLSELNYYNPSVHRAAFVLPNFLDRVVREALR